MAIVDNALAFLFPGQGSQSVGMMAGLAAGHPVVEATFREASGVLGYDLWDLVQNGPDTRLHSTQYTQPAMLAAGVAAWRVWCEASEVRPVWMAGHSLGEFSALVCAGALEFADALRLVSERARLMQEAVPPEAGAMAAILGLDDPQVVHACKQASSETEIVSAANFNAPGQVVIAGDRMAVTRALDLLKQAGAKRAVLLPVSVPSHCSLMKPAADQFGHILAEVPINTPATPVVHNVDVGVHPAPEVIRAVLEQQLCGSVRWSDSVLFISQQGVNRFVECGPGKVLLGLNKRIVPGCKSEGLFDSASLAKALELVL